MRTLIPHDFVSKWERVLSSEKILEKLLALGSLRIVSGVLPKFGEGEGISAKPSLSLPKVAPITT